MRIPPTVLLLVVGTCWSFAECSEEPISAEVQPEEDASSVNDELNSDEVSVLWMAPFFSGGGYCSEAISFALGLSSRENVHLEIMQHGDSLNYKFFMGLDEEVGATLQSLVRQPYYAPPVRENSIVICHSEPGAWNPPNWNTALCPPRQGEGFAIGRTMFETDRLPKNWDVRLNRMDQVWVPTEFHREVFTEGGVQPEKIRVIPEPVDVDFFTPEGCGTFPLHGGREDEAGGDSESFKFLSIFKWEERKGWPFLLRSYLEEFSADDNVELFILTNQYHERTNFAEVITNFIEEEQLDSEDGNKEFPAIHILPQGIPSMDMPSLYHSVDAFVLPSRGEGWGRPHVEAMSMGLPVIATLWSGPSAYMNEENSYPLEHDGFDEIVEGAFRGHKWARPSVSHLRTLMRRVYENPDEARERGVRARRDMVEQFSPERVTDILVAEFTEISKTMAEEGFESAYSQAEEEIFGHKRKTTSNRKAGGRKRKDEAGESEKPSAHEGESAGVDVHSRETTSCDADDETCVEEAEIEFDVGRGLSEEYLAHLADLGLELDVDAMREAFQAAYEQASADGIYADEGYSNTLYEAENPNSESETVTIKVKPSKKSAESVKENEAPSESSDVEEKSANEEGTHERDSTFSRFLNRIEDKVKEGVKAAKNIGEQVKSYPYKDKARELRAKIDEAVGKSGVTDKVKDLTEKVKGLTKKVETSAKSFGEKVQQFVSKHTESEDAGEDDGVW